MSTQTQPMVSTASRSSQRLRRRQLLGAAIVLGVSLPFLIALGVWGTARTLDRTWFLPFGVVLVSVAVLLVAARRDSDYKLGSPETSDPRVTEILREMASMSAARFSRSRLHHPLELMRLEDKLGRLVDLDREASETLSAEIRAFFAYRWTLAAALCRIAPQLTHSNARRRTEHQLDALAILYPHADWRDALVAARKVVADCTAAGIDPLTALRDVAGPGDGEFSEFFRDLVADHQGGSSRHRTS